MDAFQNVILELKFANLSDGVFKSEVRLLKVGNHETTIKPGTGDILFLTK